MKPTKAQIRAAAAALGSLGGRAGTGKAKARNVTSAQARAAVTARWQRYYLAHPDKKPSTHK